MSNGNPRILFANQLIRQLDEYIQGGFLGLLIDPTHKTLALKMKLEAKHYSNNPTDENWLLFVSTFRAFHKALAEQQSASLLNAINQLIKTSSFPDIIDVFTDLDQLSESTSQFNKELIVNKPSAELVMADLNRQLPLSISIGKGSPRALTEFFDIKINDETNECVVTSLFTDAVVYQGVPNTPEEATIALKAIAAELNSDMDKDKKEMINHIVPFLCQNGVLEQGLVDIMTLVTERIMIDSNLPENTPLTLSRPAHSIVMNLSQTGITFTETYLFEKFQLADQNNDLHEHTFTTPLKVVEQFACKVSKDGENAIVNNRKVGFSAYHEAPKNTGRLEPK